MGAACHAGQQVLRILIPEGGAARAFRFDTFSCTVFQTAGVMIRRSGASKRIPSFSSRWRRFFVPPRTIFSYWFQTISPF